jgi:hypothetical protein
MNEKRMVRQGDVLLIPVEDSMPISPKAQTITRKSKHGRLVLADGESSLHEHTISAEDAELVRQGEQILLTILRDQTKLAVTHTLTGELLPRHMSIELPGGLYEVRTQRRAEVTPAGMPQRWSRARD